MEFKHAHGYMMSALYITYDGLLEPLGQSQVWQYVRRLSAQHRIFLISFEKPSDLRDAQKMASMRADCEAAGIHWLAFRYHRRPSLPATAFDICVAILAGILLIIRHRIRVIHARSYVPSVAALVLCALTRCRFVFDMRGLWADERVDGQLWNRGGPVYRLAKWFERRFLLSADTVVSLTEAAVRTIKEFPYMKGQTKSFAVIPTCVDTRLFAPRDAIRSKFVLGFVGSVGVWGMPKELAEAFAALLSIYPDSRFLVVNRGEHELLANAFLTAGIREEYFEIAEAAYSQVPALMQRMDAGIFFYRPSFSKVACAPTKLAEMLAVGMPVLANAGVGDVDSVLANDGDAIGITVESFDHETLRSGMSRLVAMSRDDRVRRACRVTALKRFSVDSGAAAYARIYEQLAAL